MFRVINLCEGSDDNGELPNTNTNAIAASVSSFLVSKKRPRDNEESFKNDAHAHHPSNENDPENTPITGSVDFVVHPEPVDDVEIFSPDRRKRRHVLQNVANDTVGKCAQILKGVEATEEDVGIEDVQVADHHHKSNEGVAAATATAALHHMNSDSEQISQDNGSTNMHSQKPSNSEPPSNASGRQSRVSVWEDRLNELAGYRKIHGHCNVPQRCSENAKLASWVHTQRTQYKSHQEGKTSPITNLRIQELEGIGFEWRVCLPIWEDRLSELADYRKLHGHCNVPQHYSENIKLANWVHTQRNHYMLHLQGKTSPMPNFRIQELENLGFKWDSCKTAWEDRFSELADYRKLQGHCNVPYNYSENTKLAAWVANQRSQYKSHQEGKTSPMTNLRIQELEGIGFEWRVHANASWEVRLGELIDYHRIHGHYNVPKNYSESAKLAMWVQNQRKLYKLHVKGKTSSMTLSRVKALERLGFELDSYSALWEDRLSELSDYHKIHGHCNVPASYIENAKLGAWVRTQRNQYNLHQNGKTSFITPSRIQELESLGFEWKPSLSRRKGKQQKPSLDDDPTRVRERVMEAREHVQTTAQTRKDFSGGDCRNEENDVTYETEESDWNGEVHLGYIPGRTEEI
jgi:hypothetical protein